MDLFAEAGTTSPPEINQLLTLAPLALSIIALLMSVIRILALKKVNDLEQSDKESKETLNKLETKYDKKLASMDKDFQKMETALELVNQRERLNVKAIQDQFDLRFAQITELIDLKLSTIHKDYQKLHKDYEELKRLTQERKK